MLQQMLATKGAGQRLNAHSQGSASRLVALTRATHPLPCVAVTALATAMAVAAGIHGRSALLAVAVLCGQISVGWSNDAIDAPLDIRAGAPGQADRHRRGLAAPRSAGAPAWPSSSTSRSRSRSAGGPVSRTSPRSRWPGPTTSGSSARSSASCPYALAFGLLPVVVAAMLPGAPLPQLSLVLAGAGCGTAAHFANTVGDTRRGRDDRGPRSAAAGRAERVDRHRRRVHRVRGGLRPGRGRSDPADGRRRRHRRGHRRRPTARPAASRPRAGWRSGWSSPRSRYWWSRSWSAAARTSRRADAARFAGSGRSPSTAGQYADRTVDAALTRAGAPNGARQGESVIQRRAVVGIVFAISVSLLAACGFQSPDVEATEHAAVQGDRLPRRCDPAGRHVDHLGHPRQRDPALLPAGDDRQQRQPGRHPDQRGAGGREQGHDHAERAGDDRRTRDPAWCAGDDRGALSRALRAEPLRLT